MGVSETARGSKTAGGDAVVRLGGVEEAAESVGGLAFAVFEVEAA